MNPRYQEILDNQVLSAVQSALDRATKEVDRATNRLNRLLAEPVCDHDWVEDTSNVTLTYAILSGSEMYRCTKCRHLESVSIDDLKNLVDACIR